MTAIDAAVGSNTPRDSHVMGLIVEQIAGAHKQAVPLPARSHVSMTEAEDLAQRLAAASIAVSYMFGISPDRLAAGTAQRIKAEGFGFGEKK